MGTIYIRNVDDAAIAKIDQIWKAKGFKSRQEYLREYVNNLAVLGELKAYENKYTSLVLQCCEVIKSNTESMNMFYSILEKS